VVQCVGWLPLLCFGVLVSASMASGPEPAVLSRRVWMMKNYVGQTELYLGVVEFAGGAAGQAAAARARAYYKAQAPLFAEAEKSFVLGRDFIGVPRFMPSGSPTYDVMTTARAQTLLHAWRGNASRSSAHIEKDKCDMMRFLSSNGFPVTPIVAGPWYDLPTIEREAGRVAGSPSQSWPLLIKACHISMGFYKATRLLPDATALNASVGWYTHLFHVKPRDLTRSWSYAFDPITTAIEPGFFLQDRFAPVDMDPECANTKPTELKVEVLWGRAFLAFVDWPGCKCTEGGGAMLLRGGEALYRYVGGNWHEEEDLCVKWIVQEGHATNLWHLAEAVARTAQIDNLRVDIFLAKGQPRAMVVNEVSLSSGARYRWHWPHIAEIWAAGHRRKQYKLAPHHSPSSEHLAHGRCHYARDLSHCKKTLLPASLWASCCSKSGGP